MKNMRWVILLSDVVYVNLALSIICFTCSSILLYMNVITHFRYLFAFGLNTIFWGLCLALDIVFALNEQYFHLFFFWLVIAFERKKIKRNWFYIYIYSSYQRYWVLFLKLCCTADIYGSVCIFRLLPLLGKIKLYLV